MKQFEFWRKKPRSRFTPNMLGNGWSAAANTPSYFYGKLERVLILNEFVKYQLFGLNIWWSWWVF